MDCHPPSTLAFLAPCLGALLRAPSSRALLRAPSYARPRLSPPSRSPLIPFALALPRSRSLHGCTAVFSTGRSLHRSTACCSC